MSGLFAKYPIRAASLSLSAKYVIGDAGAQYFEKRDFETFDLKRSICFALFGSAYGSINFGVFWTLARIPWTSRWTRVAGSTCIDLLVHMPFVYFPCYYTFRSIVDDNRGSVDVSLYGNLEAAGARWKSNFLDDLRMTLAVFVPLDILLFGFVPLHFRTPFLASAGLVWPFLMSWSRWELPCNHEGV